MARETPLFFLQKKRPPPLLAMEVTPKSAAPPALPGRWHSVTAPSVGVPGVAWESRGGRGFWPDERPPRRAAEWREYRRARATPVGPASVPPVAGQWTLQVSEAVTAKWPGWTTCRQMPLDVPCRCDQKKECQECARSQVAHVVGT